MTNRRRSDWCGLGGSCSCYYLIVPLKNLSNATLLRSFLIYVSEWEFTWSEIFPINLPLKKTREEKSAKSSFAQEDRLATSPNL